MHLTKITITLLLTLILSLPFPALAFWGRGGDNQPALNLTSGYDANTVTTVTGRILSLRTTEDLPSLQIEVASGGGSLVICTGPQHYWVENGIPLDPGDEITVRGSKAQGNDGTLYLIAQKITNTTQNVSVVFRDESGRPAWAGKGRRRNQGRRDNLPAPTPRQAPQSRFD